MGAFGEKFRRQRELRGLELDAISNTTKISTRMLRALEDEHFDQLPGGVFNKGFVRAYARQIGLDEEEAVADYLTALRESQIRQQSILPDFRPQAAKPAPVAAPDFGSRQLHASEPGNETIISDDLPANYSDDSDGDDPERPEERSSQGRNEDRRNEDRRRSNIPKYPAGDPAPPTSQSSTPIPWGKLAFTLLVVTLVLAAWNFRRQAQPTPASPAPAPSTAAASNQSPAPVSTPAPAATQPSVSPSSLSAGPASPVANPSSGTSSPSVSATTPPANSTAPPAAAAAPAPPLNTASRAASHEASPDDEPAVSVRRNIKPPAIHAATPAATPKPHIILTLLIRAEKTTWISLTVDGKPITHETLIAPAHTSVRATREIIVRAGNAAGISFLLNGKEIPAQGSDGEVKTYLFDATGVHVVPQTQPAAANRQQ